MTPRLVRTALSVSLAAMICPAGCDRGGGAGGSGGAREVVLYYSADDHVAEPVIARFEALTGIDVLDRGDTEATKTTGLVQALRSERSRARADVFWSSEVFMTVQLAGEGILDVYRSAPTADWPAAYRSPEDRWYGFGCRARVVVYNNERVSADDVPQTLHDLLDARFKDRVVMARPQFGTTRGHVSLLAAAWGDARFEAWLAGMKSNGVRLVDGNSTVVRMVARGEALVGLTDTDDVVAGQRNGWPVEGLLVRHDVDDLVIGPMVIPNTAARVAGGPNPDEAALLLDFLLSAEVERMLAESDSRNIPVRPEVRERVATYDIRDPAAVPYEEISDHMESALASCDRILGH